MGKKLTETAYAKCVELLLLQYQAGYDNLSHFIAAWELIKNMNFRKGNSEAQRLIDTWGVVGKLMLERHRGDKATDQQLAWQLRLLLDRMVYYGKKQDWATPDIDRTLREWNK